MADIKISQLGEALAVTDNDILPMTASGVTNKVKAGTMKDYMIGNTDISGLGDGSVTGAIDTLDDEIDANKAQWKEQWKKNGAYNLCPIDGVTEVKQAVTFTVNSNRTISANGTASGDIYYTVASATFTVDKTGSYKIVGRPGDITGTCNLFVYVAADGGAVLTDSDGTGAIGTLTAGVVYGVSIYVASGVNISNKTFKPLLTTDLNATYDDFVEFAKTNRELTEDTKYVVGTLNTAAFTGTGMTLRSGNLYKYGKVVNFIFDIQKDSGVDPLTVTGLLPVGFRPITGFSIRCGDGSPFGVSNVQITESGELYIYFGSTGYAIGSATFITND